MSSTTLTSELDAINALLSAIGESPINTLEVSGLADVAAAKAVLNEVSRAVQTVGWHFNSEDDYPLSRDVDGRIALPSNVLKIDTTDEYAHADVVQRGTTLYNKTTRSDIFATDLEVNIVFLLGWNQLPQVARHYIMVKAARIFQARRLGAETLFKFSQQEEFDAYAAMNEAEGDTGDYNMFNGSYSVAQILER